jgi:DNA ligase-1
VDVFGVEYMSKITLYKNHGKSVGSWEGWTEGAVVFSSSVTKLGGKWVTTQYTAEAKNVGRSNETTPEEQAVLENISKSKRKIDKGYVKTKKAAEAPATNALGLKKPMLATSLDKVKPESIDWNNAFVQPKLDGHRALFVDGVLYSRSGKVINLPHIVDAINASGVQHLHLDGELYLHGKTLQELGSLIRKLTPESEQVEFHIYDVVDENASFSERTEEFKSIADCHPRIIVNPTYDVFDMEETMLLHEAFRVDGYEGTMLRFGLDGYGTDKRSRKLLKVKEFHDAEFKVVGYEEGKPYIRGDEVYQVPVWICETEDGAKFNVTANGTMEQKDTQWTERDLLVGDMLTVKFHNMSKDNIPQLPIALQWREDL